MPDIDTSPAALRALAEQMDDVSLIPAKIGDVACDTLRALAAEKEAATKSHDPNRAGIAQATAMARNDIRRAFDRDEITAEDYRRMNDELDKSAGIVRAAPKPPMSAAEKEAATVKDGLTVGAEAEATIDAAPKPPTPAAVEGQDGRIRGVLKYIGLDGAVELIDRLTTRAEKAEAERDALAARRPKVLLHWGMDGDFSWGAAEGLDVVCVDERCPNDRVYETTGDLSAEAIQRVADGRARHPIDALDQIAREATTPEDPVHD